MTRYRVEFIEICTTAIEVEADDRDFARTKALAKFQNEFYPQTCEASEILVLDLDAGEYSEHKTD